MRRLLLSTLNLKSKIFILTILSFITHERDLYEHDYSHKEKCHQALFVTTCLPMDNHYHGFDYFKNKVTLTNILGEKVSLKETSESSAISLWLLSWC